MKKGQYSYQPYGRSYRIYVCTYADERSSASSPVNGEPLYHDREAARRRVYQLNGWNYKPQDGTAWKRN